MRQYKQYSRSVGQLVTDLLVLRDPHICSLRLVVSTCEARGAYVRPSWLILALLVAILLPRCRNLSPKRAKTAQLRVNIAQNSSQDASSSPSKPPKHQKILKTDCFLTFFEMQPMQQVTKKCSRNRPKGSKNRAQDAQDATKMASWSPHGRQNASQDGPQTT